MVSKKYWVYRLTFPNNKVYIGMTTNLGYRKSQHRYSVKHNKYLHLPLYKEWKIWGESSIKTELLGCSVFRLIAEEIEKYYILQHRGALGLNVAEGGIGAGKGESSINHGKLRSDEFKKACQARQEIPIRCIETGKTFKSALEASIVLNISRGNIASVLSGTRKKAGGLTFEKL